MEPAGLTIGIVSLVSVLENAITCFLRVRMAKSFGPDLQLYVVRLEVLHLRLIRWGEAVGFGKNTDDEKPSSTDKLTPKGFLISQLFGLIENHFKEAV
jgi:hypothetical protein